MNIKAGTNINSAFCCCWFFSVCFLCTVLAFAQNIHEMAKIRTVCVYTIRKVTSVPNFKTSNIKLGKCSPLYMTVFVYCIWLVCVCLIYEDRLEGYAGDFSYK